MNIEVRIFNNFDESEKRNKDRFPKNKCMFKEYIPGILESWGNYLKIYVEQSRRIFTSPEYPWWEFHEPTWVSSLAIAIAKKYPDALLIEELPVTKKGVKTDSTEKSSDDKKGKKSDSGNVDMWCCLNPSTEENCRFSFYLEAKFGSWARLNPIPTIDELSKVRDQLADNKKENNLLNRLFKDYQKSAGKSNGNGYYTTTSPHQKEKGRKHNHVFLGMLIKRIDWNMDWPERVEFSELFGDKRIKVQGNDRNFYNFPCAGILMKDEKGDGFVSLIMMLGETKN